MATRKSTPAKQQEVAVKLAVTGATGENPEAGTRKNPRRAAKGTATTKKAESAVAKPAKTTRKKKIVTATMPKVAPADGKMIAAAARAAREVDLAQYQEEIARLAYHLWEQRGYAHGYHEEDWFRAQEEIRRRYASDNLKSMAQAVGTR